MGTADANIITLANFVLRNQKKCHCSSGGAAAELTQLFNSIQTAAKIIRNASSSLLGYTGTVNIQGEKVKKLDIFSNEVFVNMLKSSYATCLLVSEEVDDVIIIEPENRGRYMVCYDPLDGSSNIDCGVSTGTIFGIFKKEGKETPSAQDVLKSGNNLVAAGYVLYSTQTLLVMSLGDGVHEFILDTTLGEFILKESNIRIPDRGDIYSVNEGYENKWDESIKQYISSIKDKNYSSRYIGAMVADIHRTLKYGGIYLYPVLSDMPTGKLRVMYECFPMSYLITQAGGAASNGSIPILDIIPEAIHQRSPIFIGSKENVEDVVSIINSSK